ncbi:MAG: FAD-linked oxidase C-terminal domain-containing protein [Thermodesulfobacteriota bacterium]
MSLSPSILARLRAIVGAPHLSVAPEDLLTYAYDGSRLEYPPDAVAFPADTAQVAAIVALAHQEGLPVVPRGAGTGMTGGALPVAGGLVLAMSRLNRILEIDTDNGVAVVEPGVITGDLARAVEARGLFYPPDPASSDFCTIGGNVAECAGGPRAVKYGVTRDYVLGLTVVLPDGRILPTGVRTAKGVVGYDLTRLFVGSEGTLGVITRIILRLISRPAGRETFLVLGQDLAATTRLVAGILNAGILPCALEYLDQACVALVAPAMPEPLPAATTALLLVELDGEPAAVDAEARHLSALLASAPGLLGFRRAGDRTEARALWQARREISPAAFRLRPDKLSEDVVVPRSRIPDLVLFAQALGRELDLAILTFGHAGDGNIHVNIMVDRQDPAELNRAEAAKKRLFTQVLALGGTLSGEHGVGITKAASIGQELDPVSLSVMQAIKSLLDPRDILNPGKIFPGSGPAGGRHGGLAARKSP